MNSDMSNAQTNKLTTNKKKKRETKKREEHKGAGVLKREEKTISYWRRDVVVGKTIGNDDEHFIHLQESIRSRMILREWGCLRKESFVGEKGWRRRKEEKTFDHFCLCQTDSNSCKIIPQHH